MIINTLNINFIRCLAILFLLSGTSTLIHAKGKNELVQPSGFEKLVLYMGTGTFDPNNSAPRPGVVGCSGLFCNGDFFQYNIMKRTAAEVQVVENEAKEHFLEQFGIDVDDPALNERIEFSSFMVNPDFQYRVHALSEEPVSSDGWIIRDGGFSLSITDPDGMKLGGVKTDLHAPVGATMFFGHYNILTTDRRGRPDDELIINYASITPGETLPNGSFTFKCRMLNDEWGEGIGMGTLDFIPLDDGRIQGNGRNIITFPAVSTLTDFDFSIYPEFDAEPGDRKKRNKRR